MTKESLQQFANILLAGYVPLNANIAEREVNTGVYENKISEIYDKIILCPFGVEQIIVEEIANNTAQRLKNTYLEFIK